jgi:hypothetical protein
MKRIPALVAGALAAFAIHGAASAEVVGTIVSTDPAANTVVVQSEDGKQTIYRTSRTTRIEQGGDTIELRTLQPGTQVQIVAEPAPGPVVTGTVVHPVASGIIVAPTAPPKPTVARDGQNMDRDIDVDIDEEHDVDSDD